MAWEDNVVVTYGISQEIGDLRGIGEVDDLLRATQVGLGLIPNEFSLLGKTAGEVARNFEYGDGPFLHIAADTDADTRLEMGVVLVPLYHVEGYRTMRE